MKSLFSILLILFCTVMSWGQTDITNPYVVEVVNSCITVSESIIDWNKTHSFSELTSSNWRQILFPQWYNPHDGDVLLVGNVYFRFYSGGNDANGIALIATSTFTQVKHRMDVCNPVYAASKGRNLVSIYHTGVLDDPNSPRLVVHFGPYIKSIF